MSVAEKDLRPGITDESGSWPTPKQELLLKAALLRGSEALDAWKEWHDIVDIEALDFGSHRLLPQLYRNLLNHHVRHPQLSRLKSVYRYYWYKNELLLHRATELLRSFRDDGLDTMVLKGAALIPLYYRDSGLRPMQDFDLVVPVRQATRAMELLERSGWRSRFKSPETRIPIRHSTPYGNAEKDEIDLHWHILGECWNFRLDEGFWRRSAPAAIGGQPTRVLDPTDQLFHICAHGVEWNEVPPIRWVADAMAVLYVAAEIDWDRLVQLAAIHHLSLPVHDGLSYIRRKFRAPVPANIIDRLRSQPTTEIERFGYRVRIEPIAKPTTREIVHKLWYEYLWLTGAVAVWRRPSLLALWWQYRWRLENRWQLLFLLPFRALCRLFRQLRLHAGRLWAERVSATPGGKTVIHVLETLRGGIAWFVGRATARNTNSQTTRKSVEVNE